jgi:hypothetical protein
MRQNVLQNSIIHFHGAIEAKIEHLKNYDGREGTFIKKYLIGEEFNMNEWKVTWDAIKKDVWGFVGKPLVLTPDMDHPSVKDQEDYKVGEIIDVGIDELKRTAWQVSEITVPKVAEMIREGKIKYGSPTVLTYSQNTTKRAKLGNGKTQTTLERFIPAHDALVADPAYGKEVDKIPAICDGTGEGCGLKLLEVSASVQKDAEINSDNINQLTIVPFARKAIKKHFKGSTINEIVGYIKNADSSKLKSCVSRKIRIISDEDPKTPNDKVVAMAYSYCRKSKSADIENLIAEDIGEDIFAIKEQLELEIELKDQLSHEISNVKTKLKQITA